jgi:hypothetical protein
LYHASQTQGWQLEASSDLEEAMPDMVVVARYTDVEFEESESIW